MTTALNATAMVVVPDLDDACAFLRDCLGFDTTFRADNYAYCRRDQSGIRLLAAAPGTTLGEVMVYIDTDDVDAYWAAHQGAIQKLPNAHRRAPFDQDYGQREFHLIHGPCLFFVGKVIKEPT